MSKRRKILLRSLVAVAIVGALLVAFVRSGDDPQPVFRLRQASVSMTTGLQPQSVYHDRQVDAEFDYVGPPLSFASHGAVGRFMRSVGLGRPAPAPRWVLEDIVLLDADGREVCRIPTVPPPTTKPSVRHGWMEYPRGGRFTYVWNFDLPPGVDPASPKTFRTRLGLNEHAPVVIEAALPPVRPTAASRPSAG